VDTEFQIRTKKAAPVQQIDAPVGTFAGTPATMNQVHVMHLQVEQLFTYRIKQMMAERLQNTDLMVYGLHTVQAVT
jgi:hypothetical protein